MRVKFFHLLLISISSSVLLTSTARAALNLELTQGISKALPIAIVPFDQQQANLPGDVTITEVITHDLQHSGQFRVKKLPAVAQQQAINRQHQGVDYVLMGQVRQLDGQRYRVSLQLISTVDESISDPKRKGKKVDSPLNNPKRVVLNQIYEAPQSGLRQLAHHISDTVYQKLTGLRGIFSTRVAYVLVQPHHHQPTNYTLEVSDIDGFSPQPLLTSTQPIMSPTWSPDGKTIAYVSFEGGHANIYQQNVMTARRWLIASYPGINGAPAFSPDGKRLALVLTLTGHPKIYVYDLVSKQLSRITQGYSIDTEPAWALDGKSLLFTSDRGGRPQIYRYYFGNKQIDRVTFAGNYNAHASFLPGNYGIIMMHRDLGLFGIARQDLTNGQVRVLIQTGSDESPSVSPNGKMIVYATQYGGRGVLALISSDGRIRLRLPAREGMVREPAWSPYLS